MKEQVSSGLVGRFINVNFGPINYFINPIITWKFEGNNGRIDKMYRTWNFGDYNFL